jgi:exopolyphosphatase/guanosine-5'-triphosphate,3'-diphosphate pyrophosphatase
MMRRAAIDVGTNSVKLLVAEVDGRRVHPLLEQVIQTRLGAGSYGEQRLGAEAMRRTVTAIVRLAQTAAAQGVDRPRVIATSAAREARNAADLVAAVQARTGLALEIIPGEREAEWAYLGVTTDPVHASHPLLILDVGGGSTELVLGCADNVQLRRSYPIGTVRLLERIGPADPPTAADYERCVGLIRDTLESDWAALIQPAVARQPRLRLVGSSGTATILAQIEGRLAGFERRRIDHTRLSREAVAQQCRSLWSQTLAQRRMTVGLPPDRADVILGGAAVYDQVMQLGRLSELWITTRGFRFAAVLDGTR